MMANLKNIEWPIWAIFGSLLGLAVVAGDQMRQTATLVEKTKSLETKLYTAQQSHNVIEEKLREDLMRQSNQMREDWFEALRTFRDDNRREISELNSSIESSRELKQDILTEIATIKAEIKSLGTAIEKIEKRI